MAESVELTQLVGLVAYKYEAGGAALGIAVKEVILILEVRTIALLLAVLLLLDGVQQISLVELAEAEAEAVSV